MSLDLPKTKLAVLEDSLIKTGKSDTLVAELPFAEITNIYVEKTADYLLPVIVIVFFTGLAAISVVYVPFAGLKWVGALICLCFAAFASVMSSGCKIVIETKDGSVGYPVLDLPEEADGFVISIKRKLRSLGS